MRIDVFKRTQDNWCPNYSDNLVEVSLLPLGEGGWRVCAWGADDFGLEKDFTSATAAMITFMEVIGWEFVDMQKLRELGFIAA